VVFIFRPSHNGSSAVLRVCMSGCLALCLLVSSLPSVRWVVLVFASDTGAASRAAICVCVCVSSLPPLTPCRRTRCTLSTAASEGMCARFAIMSHPSSYEPRYRQLKAELVKEYPGLEVDGAPGRQSSFEVCVRVCVCVCVCVCR
jgi:hypothetical protein